MKYLSKPYKNKFYYWLDFTIYILHTYLIILMMVLILSKIESQMGEVICALILLTIPLYRAIYTLVLFLKSRIIKFDEENIYLEDDNNWQSYPITMVLGIKTIKFNISYFKMTIKNVESNHQTKFIFHKNRLIPIRGHKKIREEVLLLAKMSQTPADT